MSQRSNFLFQGQQILARDRIDNIKQAKLGARVGHVPGEAVFRVPRVVVEQLGALKQMKTLFELINVQGLESPACWLWCIRTIPETPNVDTDQRAQCTRLAWHHSLGQDFGF